MVNVNVSSRTLKQSSEAARASTVGSVEEYVTIRSYESTKAGAVCANAY